ncbi:MAG TPA: glycoside hydrolase domain-containing protein, partial [Sumerlaeia bacterium]|nr:glycoside hydrolase domain-containing protein [Sumerlaeia bacterium]
LQYGIGSWAPEGLGNHRVRLRVRERADAVWAHIPWRRRDREPEKKGVVVLDAKTGERVQNVARVHVGRECGDLVFQPISAPGECHLYFLPYTVHGFYHGHHVKYLPPESTADPAWLERNGLRDPNLLAPGNLAAFPKAEVIAIQAVSEFHRFDPMEIVATAEETRDLIRKGGGRSYLLFPEDRERPIRMTRDLPLRWIRRAREWGGEDGRLADPVFSGEASRGEFYAFQVGIFAALEDLEDVGVDFGHLVGASGETIPADRLRCFNLGGVDWTGRSFRRALNVNKGSIQPLWLGLQIPPDQAPGAYEGALTIRPKNAEASVLRIRLAVNAEVLGDCGDAEPRRLSRLRWLDSTIGFSDDVIAPYAPLEVKDRTIRCLGRALRLGDAGLPESVQSFFGASVDRLVEEGREILSEPVSLNACMEKGKILPGSADARILTDASAAVAWQSQSETGDLAFRLHGRMEPDGHVGYAVAVRARSKVRIESLRLDIPLRRDAAQYILGAKRTAGRRPREFSWEWKLRSEDTHVWLGDVNAGLHCTFHRLETGSERRTGEKDAATRCVVLEEAQDGVRVRADYGPHHLAAGEEITIRFSFLVTPLKLLDRAHWRQRYYHPFIPAVVPIDKAVASGANVINLHHGSPLNPNINYPFLAVDSLKAYVREAHKKGVQVKIYNTIRELTTRLPELWALRSLPDDVFAHGDGGGGDSWLEEHLDGDYVPAWHQPIPDPSEMIERFHAMVDTWADLQEIKDRVDFRFVYDDLQDVYGGAFSGPPCEDPVRLVKLELAKRLYQFERDDELLMQTFDWSCFRDFIDIEMDEPQWERDTLGRFRERIGTERLERILDKTVALCPERFRRRLREGLRREARRRPFQEVDAAIRSGGLSRWHNYYLEGLDWLLREVGIDGLYLDGFLFDREVTKRLRRILDRRRPGRLIDLHGYGAASIEHLPYLNSLWVGEGAHYDAEPPDAWLAGVSGIPFGLFSEMLGGGNPWRGMLYGMTTRLGWVGGDTRNIWREWEDYNRSVWKLWDHFGIEDARMVGYWDPACPVTTDAESVLATAYVKTGKTLIALASWAEAPRDVRLIIDWDALGLDPQRSVLSAPAVTGFQSPASFAPTDRIPVEPKRGRLFVVHES